MEELTRKEAYKIINQYIKDNGSIRVDMYGRDNLYNDYLSLMKENVNKNLDKQNQGSILTNIMSQIDTAVEVSPEIAARSAVNDMSDVKYLDYYNKFIYEGAREDIIQALHDNGLSTNVLAGVRLHQIGHNHFDTSQGRVDVYQEYEVDENGNMISPFILIEFKITLNGREIFSVANQDKKELFERIKQVTSKQTSKSGKSILERVLVDNETGEEYRMWRTKRGIRFTNIYGNFVSKDYIRGINGSE